jgi:tRNA uridine 5-carbamoylmethylation protein Kti12
MSSRPVVVVIALFGLPASGKSTLARAAAEILPKASSASVVDIVELDAMLFQHQDPSAASSWQGPEQWFVARDKFYAAVSHLVDQHFVSDASLSESGVRVVLAVDNMPLKSMRSRVRSAALAGARVRSSSQQNCALAFASIGVSCPVEVALHRNAQRSGVARVPDSVIHLMAPRMEYSSFDTRTHFVIDGVQSESAALAEVIREKILAPLSVSEFPLIDLAAQQATGAAAAAASKHDSSKTLAHLVDLARRQANGHFMQSLKAAGTSAELLKRAASTVVEKKFVELDRRIIELVLSGADESDEKQLLEQAVAELGAVRDLELARLLPPSLPK